MNPLTVIGHTDMISNFTSDFRYLTVPEGLNTQFPLAELKQLRPLVVFASLCPFDFQDNSDRLLAAGHAWQRWRAFREAAEKIPTLRICDDFSQIDPQDAEHIQLLLHLEGADPIEKPDELVQFRLLGGTSLSLTWNKNNRYAGGAFDDGRLTPLGKEFLAQIKELGLLLDLSHLNEMSFWDVLNEYDGPLFVSHANVRELMETPHNLSRRQIDALRYRKAWVGVSLAPEHITTKSSATIDDLLRHIDYLVEHLGSHLVGIGADFGGVRTGLLTDLPSAGALPELLNRLRTRGWTDTQIEAFQGTNFLELLKK